MRESRHGARRAVLWAGLLAAAGLTAWQVRSEWASAPFTILVLGSDTRSASEPGRSDAIFVLRADPARRSMSGLSLPRDLYVPIRGLPTLQTNRINTALFYGDYFGVPGGGRRAARETVSRLLGVPIDGVVVLGFPIVQDIVDSIGGVEVYIDHLVVDRSFFPVKGGRGYAVWFGPGWNYLDGRRALEFVRLRKPDTDFGRMDRNRQFVAALQEALEGRLGAWQRLRLLARVKSRIRTDMSPARKTRTAWVFSRCADGPIRWNTLARDEVEAAVTAQGAQVLVPVPGALKRAGLRLLEGRTTALARSPGRPKTNF
ncbi:MAG: LCP family protein [Kiritimatiellae bacterium]|nr:LCP family protein [Kiritimatiellia bacterium]